MPWLPGQAVPHPSLPVCFLRPLPHRQSTTSEKPSENTTITLNEPVALTFALRYLNNFAKATPLTPQVGMRTECMGSAGGRGTPLDSLERPACELLLGLQCPSVNATFGGGAQALPRPGQAM